MVTYYKSPVMPPLTYVGCFDNSNPNRIHRLNLDGIYEFDVASCFLDAQLNNLPGFGMEHPAGIAQDGYAECVRLNTVPPTMNRMPDSDCETEMFNGFRLGGSHRVAVYKPILVSSTGPLQGVPSSKLSTGGGSTSRNMEFRKSRPRGATGEYTYPTNGPQTSNSKSAEFVSMNPPNR